MKIGTSCRCILFIIRNLLSFTLVSGLQNIFLYVCFNVEVNATVGGSNVSVGNSGDVNFRLPSLSSAMSSEKPRIFRNKHHHEHHWGPFFEEPRNLTTSSDNIITAVHLYTEAALNCRVGMLKDKTVMWARRTPEKVSLLTVGNVTYSSDPRISVKFQYPNNWRLLINPTQWDDAGIYMCQVSTHPPRLFTTNLNVIEPPLRLIDDHERNLGDRYYKPGSAIDLFCQVSRSFLYKEQKSILKSLKPLYTSNDIISSPSTASNNSSSGSLGKDKRKGIGSTSTLSLGYSNNDNKIQSKITANTSKSNQVSFNLYNGENLSVLETTSSFKAFNNNLVQHVSQSETSVKNQANDFKQFGNVVFWLKDNEVLPSLILTRASLNDKWFTSRITIPHAKITDSGNYSCSIGRMFFAIVQVQVLTAI